MTTTPKKLPESKVLTYKLYTYDVWGNARGGFEVNDVYSTGEKISIRCRRTIYNAGTPHEFSDYSPTDRQLNRACGCRGAEWDGETKQTLYATAKNGKPLGELRFIGDDKNS